MYGNEFGNDGDGQNLNDSTRSQPRPPQPPADSNPAGFHCITPDPGKHQRLIQGARMEEQMYEQYRSSARIGYVSESSRLGGGSVSEDVVRQRAQQQMQKSKMERLRKQEQYKADKRRQEEEECSKKKAEARRKAEQLERYKQQQAEREALKYKEEHRRTNEEFLSRLEQRTKPVNKPATATPSQTSSSPGSSQNVQSRHCLDQLQRMFPLYDKNVLAEILKEANYDFNVAYNLLSS